MFITYYIGCCFVISIVILLGLVGGFFTHLIGRRSIKTTASRNGASIFVGILISCLVILSVLGYWTYLSNDFYNYAGDFDYYRMPLEYPYELSMVDMVDCASIKKWQEDDLIVTGITHYFKQDNIVVGKISAHCFFPDEDAWFSFDCKTGISAKYTSEEEFYQALKELGFEKRPTLLTVQENWNLWAEY